MDAKTQPWERQPGETLRAYTAFCLYRDIGLGRSIDSAWRLHAAAEDVQPTNGRAPRTWRNWSRHNDWVSRCAAWDARQAAKRIEAMDDVALAELDDYRTRQIALSRTALLLAVNLLNICARRIEAMEEGEITPAQLPAYLRAAAALAETTMNAEALALGVTQILTDMTKRL